MICIFTVDELKHISKAAHKKQRKVLAPNRDGSLKSYAYTHLNLHGI